MPPSFISPLPGALVTSVWGDDRSYRGGTHRGLDFRAIVGTPIKAVADGVVFQSKDTDTSEAGKWVGIEHAGGWVSRYLHLDQPLVTIGQRVAQGQIIAKSGATGIARSAPHLHYDMAIRDLANYPWPRPGSPGKASWGPYYPIPAEPWIPTTYTTEALARVKRLGLPLAVAVGGGLALIGLTAAALWFFFLRKR